MPMEVFDPAGANPCRVVRHAPPRAAYESGGGLGGGEMLLFRLRKPVFLVLLAFGVASVAFLALFKVMVRERYTPLPRVVGAWGQGDHRFGRALGKDGHFHGPQSFWVTAAGGVDVLDTYNSRVLEFSPQGLLTGGFSYRRQGFQLMDDLTAGRRHNLYLANASVGEVEKFTPAGRLLLTFPPPAGSTRPRLEGLAAGKSGAIYLQDLLVGGRGYQGRLAVYDRRGTLLRTLNTVRVRPDGARRVERGSPIPVEVSSFVPGGQGDLYVETVGDGLERSVLVYSFAGRLLRRFQIGEADLIWSSSLVGVDGAGRIYVGFNLGTPQGKVEQFSPRGKLLQVLAAPAARTVQAHVYARVNQAGDVYLLREDERGLTVQELVRHTLRRWVPRW